ncbi:helix-turn-helix transcriptional regulator [Haematospirillum jordaniae]|uniref:helix-turn-helix domain-containing protein n=1 Tax=Haematospirillum jordaniae TaxID=1549855 RepID=UPI0014328EC4|nr:AraC family transcriptional regulator [Haematospirillum jordaniae]NKD86338.1 helix-turn-helix transcriptional regulator [Haematospirillum jordaniae]
MISGNNVLAGYSVSGEESVAASGQTLLGGKRCGFIGQISRSLTLSGCSLRLYDFYSETGLQQKHCLEPVFVICITLSGTVRFDTADQGEYVEFSDGSCSLIYADQPVQGMLCVPSHTQVSAVELRFPPRAVEAFLSTTSVTLAGYLERLSGQCRSGVLPVQFPVPSVIRNLASDMLSKGIESGCDRLWQEAWSLEILAHVLRRLEDQPVTGATVPTTVLSLRDRRKVAEAHRLMVTQLDYEWSIRELATAVGLNENKLKKGFGCQFGSSVYACLQKHRMQAAADLLRNCADSVTDVALSVGYSSPAHFAKVFRRYHGVSPREFRRI